MMVPPNVRDVADNVSVGGAAPVPVNSTVCDPASSTIVNTPVAGPGAAGANCSCNWQSVLAASDVLPQELLASANGPETVTLVRPTAVPPLFSAVTAWALDLDPTCACPKSILVGLRLTTPGVAPVPLSATVNFPPATFAETDNCPLRLPDCVGRNFTWMVQLAREFTVEF